MPSAPTAPQLDLPPRPPGPPGAGRHGRLVLKLVAAVVAAFAFGFALVPLYDTLCQAIGLNGKGFTVGGLTASRPASERVDRSRVVTVEFTGTVMPGLPWEMRPLTLSVDLHPGEMQAGRFLVHNRSDRPVVGQAVPSVSPGQAAAHFEKIDCFCFARQTLGPGEAREMPVVFIVKPELDDAIRTVTLSYAFFPAPEGQPERQPGGPNR